MVDKTELERVWNRELVGWLKSHCKNTKGKKSFTLIAKPYIRNYLDPVELVVYAKTHKDAMKQSFMLQDKIRKAYPSTQEEYKNLGWTIGAK